MACRRIALLTEARYADPSPAARATSYVANILAEDRILGDALHRVGIDAVRVDWARFDEVEGRADAALFRTTWDYFHRWPEFSAFLERVVARVRLFNPLPLVLWNVDKHYLAELAGGGVLLPRTVYVDPGDDLSLVAAAERVGAWEVVAKPCISGAARQTRRIRVDGPGLPEQVAWFAELSRRESMIVQPFVPEVLVRGEISVVWIGGCATHAVRKRARRGDFRVQDDHGGTVEPCPLRAELREAADAAVGAVARCTGTTPLYARVDVVETDAGPLLMELEMVEPELFFRFCPAAAMQLARTLARELDAG